MKVVQIEGSAQVIGTVQLVVQLPKSDVLIGKTRKGAQLRTEELIRRGTLGCRHRRRTSHWEGRKTRVTDRIHLPGTVIGEEVEKFVLDDRTTHAATELLLLVYRLRIVAERFLKRIESVQ